MGKGRIPSGTKEAALLAWVRRGTSAISVVPFSGLGKIGSHVDPSVETLGYFQGALTPAIYELACKSSFLLE
jgi:hypothetical protein